MLLGNPPYVNAIEGEGDERTKALTRHLHPVLKGTADLGYYFLSRCGDVAQPASRIGLIVPRGFLNAPAAEDLRQWLLQRHRPNQLFVSTRADLFAGAAVFICALTLGPHEECQVGEGDLPASASWRRGPFRGTNWWKEFQLILHDMAGEAAGAGTTLGECFDIGASMTTGDAYELKPFIDDDPDGPGQKLITTGLIDPNCCFWGETRCRYLGEDFQHPRVRLPDFAPPSLQRRLEKSRRPKVLVAGLSSRIECFLDEQGECVGAVSTWSIYHPADDLDALRACCDFLLREEQSTRFRLELGGNAMGGGNTTMKKSFLMQLSVDF